MILLIIAIALLIFQMVVLATAIDIGEAAIWRNAQMEGATSVDMNNSSNGTGTITQIQIFCSTNITDCEVATFFVVSENNLSTRDTEYIGTVLADDTRTFDVNLDVTEGDYIGIWSPSGKNRCATSGGTIGVWYSYSNKIPCTNQTFSILANGILSLYGTGATEEEEVAKKNVIFMGSNF